MDTVKDALGKVGKKAAGATKKAGNLAGNMWQHCKYKFYSYGHYNSCTSFMIHSVWNAFEVVIVLQVICEAKVSESCGISFETTVKSKA